MTYTGRRGDLIVAGSLFGLTLLLGGGSVVFPIERMIVELGAVLALAWFCFKGWHAEAGLSVSVGMIIAVLTMLLILVQMVPLPPSLWHALPGRSLPASVLAAVGAPDEWLPISFDPAATRASVFYFLVPVMLFVATIHLDRDDQNRLLAIFAAFALGNAVLVVLQTQGFADLSLYQSPDFGLFANKNHCAVMLVAAMPVAVALCRNVTRARPPASQYLASAAVLALLTLTIFGCLSRAGLALMPIGVGASMVIMARDRVSPRTIIIAVIIAAALLSLAYILLPRTQIVAHALERFNTNREGRYDFWPNVVAAIRTYFPVGSGLGTFVSVFMVHETLENVHLTYTNHAHSDYLEILLETGIFGAGLVLVFLVWFLATSWRRFRDNWNGAGFDPILASVTAITVLLIHSGLDYPLRTLALAGVAAVSAGILASPREFRTYQIPSGGQRRRTGVRKRS